MIILYEILSFIIYSCSFFPLMIYLFFTGKISKIKDYLLLQKKISKEKSVLFHCVSVGECSTILDFVKLFSQKIIVTTTCGEVFSFLEKKNSNIHVVMLPPDFFYMMKRLLKIYQVEVVFISEVDYWPNLILASSNLNIPVIILNGRMSDRTFEIYSKLNFFVKKIFQKITYVFPQNGYELTKFKKFLPARKIINLGNMKFGNLKQSINTGKLCMVAGSTHWPEEKFLIDAAATGGIKMYIAPRNMTYIEKIKKYIEEKNLTYSLYSEGKLDENIVIVDVYGVLDELYSKASAAYIGGGFTKTGVHNFLEAACYSIPFITGKNVKNFKSVIYPFKENCCVIVDNVEHISDIVLKICNQVAGDSMIMKKKIERIFLYSNGASFKIKKFLDNSFNNEKN